MSSFEFAAVVYLLARDRRILEQDGQTYKPENRETNFAGMIVGRSDLFYGWVSDRQGPPVTTLRCRA